VVLFVLDLLISMRMSQSSMQTTSKP
jgi:hypothetical protein